MDESGNAKLIQGKPVRSAPQGPDVSELFCPLAHIYVESNAQSLTPSAILPILSTQTFNYPLDVREHNHNVLSNTLSKLKDSQPITVVFWGDSITGGADATNKGLCFANVFITTLKTKFPNASISAINLGVGGTNTNGRLAGFQADVLTHKPDLIVIEFVNDLLLPQKLLETNYNTVLLLAKHAGAEVILLSPHFPTPKLMGVKDWASVGAMPYIRFLRHLTQTSQAALADVSLRWEHLDREGLRPDLMLVDRLIHPNDRGHAIYAEELIKCFE